MRKMKKIVVTFMMVSMLLTFFKVGSNVGIMPYGETIIITEKELE